jgi:hypothetical protein
MTVGKLFRIAALVAAGSVLLLIVAVLVAQRVSDGPMGPLAGGALRAGELVTDRNVDWTYFPGGELELQLVEPEGSRTTGAFVYEGNLYVPCDLGFISRRVPSRRFRWILSAISSVKHWHEDALRDGRVVLRIKGNRYERQAVRVTDPALLATLRSTIENAANQVFSPPGLLDVPADPEAIWFFRMDPRPDASGGGPS